MLLRALELGKFFELASEPLVLSRQDFCFGLLELISPARQWLGRCNGGYQTFWRSQRT